MHLRYLLCLVLLTFLCQCSTIQRDVLPVVHPGTDELVVFALRNVRADTVRPSNYLAAIENVQAEVAADNKASRGFGSMLGLTDPKTQGAGLMIGGVQAQAETKSGRKLAILIPLIQVVTNQLPPATVQAAMPRIQSYCYRVLAHHMDPVRKSELKQKPKKP